MSTTLVLNEPAADFLLTQGWTGLRLERGVSSTNLGSFTLVAQIPYVAGQTSYSFVDATGASSDWYRAARYGPSIVGTFTPPWPVTPPVTTAGDGARRSLRNCRRMLARRLGSLQVVTTTEDGNEAGTTIVARALANQIDANRYRGWWAMPTDGVSAGEVRSLAEGALNQSRGQLAVNQPYLSQIVAGTQVELHRLLPPDEAYGPPLGLRQCLNLALAECWVLDRLAVTSTGGVTLDLSAFGDWLDPAAVAELYGPPISGVPASPFGPYAVRSDAASTLIDVVGLASGTTVNVELTRPGDSYIRVGGGWTDNQQGFQSDTDECLFQPMFLVEVALCHAYEALANIVTGVPQARYTRMADEQRKKANVMKLQLPRPAERSGSVPRYGGDWSSKESFV